MAPVVSKVNKGKFFYLYEPCYTRRGQNVGKCRVGGDSSSWYSSCEWKDWEWNFGLDIVYGMCGSLWTGWQSMDWIPTKLNIQQFHVLPTHCIYVFCVDLRTNSDYFTIQH